MPIFSIPKPLRNKLGDEASDSLAEMMNQFGQEHRDAVLTLTEEKFEHKLTREISQLREEIVRGDSSLREEISNLRTELNVNNTKTIKWMFIFWIGQIGALLGILFAVFK